MSSVQLNTLVESEHRSFLYSNAAYIDVAPVCGRTGGQTTCSMSTNVPSDFKFFDNC